MSEGGEGTSEIVDFILYMFVLGPAVEWCLKSPKVNPSRPGSIRGIALATLLLAAIAGTKLSFELVGRDPNHFCTLGVRTDATAAEIRRAYKDISLKYHPDKNPDDKSAGDKFRQAATAYEVLKDASKRTSYNKFGATESQMGSDVASQLGTLSIFYAISNLPSGGSVQAVFRQGTGLPETVTLASSPTVLRTPVAKNTSMVGRQRLESQASRRVLRASQPRRTV